MEYLHEVLKSLPGLIPWGWVMWILFLLVALIQLIFYWYFLSKAAWHKRKAVPDPDYLLPVSVIICARNDYPNLQQNLPMVLEQDYPEFEVVVVDDGSNDDSDMLLKEMSNRYSHLKVVTIGNSVTFVKGKKLPLSIGIKSATHNVLLHTDASCRPASPHWIRHMALHFTTGSEVVLGYGAFNPKPGFFNKLVRFDALYCAARYMGMAKAGIPYMGVGRNLAYTRALFYSAKGFTSHYHLIAGDDDLFVNQVARKNNTAIELSAEARTLSDAPVRFAAWFRQRVRTFRTFSYYKARHRSMLRLFHWSHFLFYPLFVLSLIYWGLSVMGYVAAGIFALYLASHFVIISHMARNLQEEKISLFSLPAHILLPFLYAIFAVYTLFMKKHK